MSPTPAQLDAAFKAARRFADDTGYGGWISNDQCRKLAEAIATALLNQKA